MVGAALKTAFGKVGQLGRGETGSLMVALEDSFLQG